LKDPNSYGIRKRSGRKKIVTPRLRRQIINHSSNKRISSAQIINDLCVKLSRSTIDNVRRECAHLIFKKKVIAPKLNDSHKAKRLEFAKDHMTWKTEWYEVAWTDEKKFNLDGPDGFSYYWHDLRKEPLIFSKRQQGGGGVMIWASFAYNFKSEISFISGKMNAVSYQELLSENIDAILEAFPEENWIFQQDNAPAHRAKATINWFKRKKIALMSWPPLSPDLNPIENAWGLLARKVYDNGRQFTTIQDLKSAITRAWDEIDQNQLNALVDSMPTRIFELIRLNGSKTKY